MPSGVCVFVCPHGTRLHGRGYVAIASHGMLGTGVVDEGCGAVEAEVMVCL